MCECGERLSTELKCTVCEKKYQKTPEGIQLSNNN